MAVLTLQNEHLEMDVTIFSDLFSSHKNLVQTDQLLVVSGTVSRDSFTDGIKIVAKEIWGLDQFRRQFAKRLHITISHHHSELLEKVMRKLPEKKSQACPVQITLKLPHSKASFTTNKSWETQPTHIKRQLNELHAAINAEYEF